MTYTLLVSVIFTAISIADLLKKVPFAGVTLYIEGAYTSVSVVVTFPTSIVTLYNCGEKSPSSVMKLKRYWKYLDALVGNSVCFVVSLATSTNDSPAHDWSSQERTVRFNLTAPRRYISLISWVESERFQIANSSIVPLK